MLCVCVGDVMDVVFSVCIVRSIVKYSVILHVVYCCIDK